MPINLGMFAMPIHRPERPYPDILREDQEAVVLADQLGYSEFFVGEHHTSQLERITSPLMFLASVANQTKNIRLGTGVLNLPLMHPVAAASNLAQFDNLCGGRLIMGIGSGSLYTDIEAFDLTKPDVRGRMMMESLEHVHAIWSREPPFELAGEFWNIKLKDSLWPEFKVGWAPRPLQQPFPPVAIAVITPNSYGCRTAGRRGWIAMSGNFIHKRYLREHWETYAAGCEEVGRRPDPANWRVGRCCLVTESEAQAEDYLADPESALNYYYKFFRFNFSKGRGALHMVKPDPAMSDDATTVEKITRSQVICGTPDRVLDQLVALREEVGHFGTLLATSHDWDQPQLWKDSMRLLAQDVMPRFNRAIALNN